MGAGDDDVLIGRVGGDGVAVFVGVLERGRTGTDRDVRTGSVKRRFGRVGLVRKNEGALRPVARSRLWEVRAVCNREDRNVRLERLTRGRSTGSVERGLRPREVRHRRGFDGDGLRERGTADRQNDVEAFVRRQFGREAGDRNDFATREERRARSIGIGKGVAREVGDVTGDERSRTVHLDGETARSRRVGRVAKAEVEERVLKDHVHLIAGNNVPCHIEVAPDAQVTGDGSRTGNR